MTMPKQKPHRSEQAVATPVAFLNAVRQRLQIVDFAVDLAADHTNFTAPLYFTEEINALVQPWSLYCGPRLGWGWLNPPFGDIPPWAAKCWEESRKGACVALLVPAATDTDWWHDSVRGKGYVTYLRNRITFVGHTQGYPKGLALVLYAPYLEGGECSWKWATPKPSALRKQVA